MPLTAAGKAHMEAFAAMTGKRKRVPKSTRKYVNQRIRNSKPLKGFLYEINSNELSTTWGYQDISLISAGDDYDAREGQKINPQSLSGILEVIRDSGAAAGSYMRYNVALIQWHPNSATENPDALAKIFESATAGITAYSPTTMDPALNSKFKVLWHRRGCVGTRETGSDGHKGRNLHRIFVPGKKMSVINYNDDAATTGANKIFFVWYSDQATGADNGTMSFNYQLRFRDS